MKSTIRIASRAAALALALIAAPAAVADEGRPDAMRTRVDPAAACACTGQHSRCAQTEAQGAEAGTPEPVFTDQG